MGHGEALVIGGIADHDDGESSDDEGDADDDQAHEVQPPERDLHHDEQPPHEHLEEAPLRLPRNPAEPTPDERRRHWLTHLPPRPWCPVRAKARGEEDPHVRSKKDEEGLPQLAI